MKIFKCIKIVACYYLNKYTIFCWKFNFNLLELMSINEKKYVENLYLYFLIKKVWLKLLKFV